MLIWTGDRDRSQPNSTPFRTPTNERRVQVKTMGQIHTFNHSTSLFKYKNKKNSNTKKIFKDIIVKKSTHKDRKSRAGSNHSKILG